MKLLTKIALDVTQGAQWARVSFLMITVTVLIIENAVMWTHDLSWFQLGLLIILGIILGFCTWIYLRNTPMTDD